MNHDALYCDKACKGSPSQLVYISILSTAFVAFLVHGISNVQYTF